MPGRGRHSCRRRHHLVPGSAGTRVIVVGDELPQHLVVGHSVEPGDAEGVEVVDRVHPLRRHVLEQRADLAVETGAGGTSPTRRGARRRRAPSTLGTVSAGASRRRAARRRAPRSGPPRPPSGPRAPGPAARRPSPRPQRRRIAARRHRRGIIGAMSHCTRRSAWVGSGPASWARACARTCSTPATTSPSPAGPEPRRTRSSRAGGVGGHAGRGRSEQ